MIDGDYVEGPRNSEFRIVRGTVWTTNTVAPAGCGLIFVSINGGGVCSKKGLPEPQRPLDLWGSGRLRFGT